MDPGNRTGASGSRSYTLIEEQTLVTRSRSAACSSGAQILLVYLPSKAGQGWGDARGGKQRPHGGAAVAQGSGAARGALTEGLREGGGGETEGATCYLKRWTSG